MKTLIFNNGASIDFIECFNRTEIIQGVERSVLDFRLSPESASLDAIDELFSAEACSRVVIRTNSGEYAHENYGVRVSLSKQSFIVVTSEGKASVEQISVKMAQYTQVEIELAELMKRVNELTQSNSY